MSGLILGEQPGRMLFVFTPAAKIEGFFEETSKPDARVMDPQRFEAHGMKIVGRAARFALPYTSASRGPHSVP